MTSRIPRTCLGRRTCSCALAPRSALPSASPPRRASAAMFAVPYPEHAHQPAWFATTARANFCEEDYLLTPYVAEFFNTLTNAAYVIYAVYGIHRLRRSPHALILCLPYVGLAAVGICSAVFHATVTYWGQMMDDTSMIFATAFVVHRAYSYAKSPSYSRSLALAIVAAFVVFAAYHCYTDEFVVHATLFLLMVVAVRRKTQALIRLRVTAAVLKKVKTLESIGAFCAIFGYLAWSIDRHLCDPLTRLRRASGQPFGYLLELHGWWHCLTAISAYTFMALVEFLTIEEPSRGPAFAWPVGAYLTPSPPQKHH